MGFFDWKWKADKDANSPEAKEQAFLQDFEATKAKNLELEAKIAELQNQLAQANGTVETAMANVVAERTKLAEERATFDAFVKEKTAWLNEPSASPVQVKSGFQPDANNDANAQILEKEPWADAVNEYLNNF
jgi:predicted  nucleic acid-binding Zn-ribbon protein